MFFLSFVVIEAGSVGVILMEFWDYFLLGSFLRIHGQSVMDLWTLIVKNTAKYSQVMDVEVRIIHWDYGASGRMIVTVLSLRIMNLVCMLSKWNGERSIIKILPCTNALTFHAKYVYNSFISPIKHEQAAFHFVAFKTRVYTCICIYFPEIVSLESILFLSWSVC